ncbi:MAG: ssl1498 family light-harvesting-like protein [Cyanobacteria bacterium P01_G01_bin.38]
MNDNKTQSKELKSNQPNHSDGSELIPAEVQANMRQNDESSVDTPAVSGSTIDDEGRLNNFAVEPEVYPSEYPSPHQQRRYVYWGIAAALLVVSLVLISALVS